MLTATSNCPQKQPSRHQGDSTTRPDTCLTIFHDDSHQQDPIIFTDHPPSDISTAARYYLIDYRHDLCSGSSDHGRTMTIVSERAWLLCIALYHFLMCLVCLREGRLGFAILLLF